PRILTHSTCSRPMWSNRWTKLHDYSKVSPEGYTPFMYEADSSAYGHDEPVPFDYGHDSPNRRFVRNSDMTDRHRDSWGALAPWAVVLRCAASGLVKVSDELRFFSRLFPTDCAPQSVQLQAA